MVLLVILGASSLGIVLWFIIRTIRALKKFECLNKNVQNKLFLNV
jgi:hypothetical protein